MAVVLIAVVAVLWQELEFPAGRVVSTFGNFRQMLIDAVRE